MSVQSEITRINTAVSNSYTSIDNKHGCLPSSKNLNNLPTAIRSISNTLPKNGLAIEATIELLPEE